MPKRKHLVTVTTARRGESVTALIRRADRKADLIEMAYERGLSPTQFADLAKRMDGDKAKILTVLRGL
jgi:hypothetical protein